jgi:hypothetical protein
LIVRERTDRGFDPRSTPRWRLKKTIGVYLVFIEANAYGVSSGADRGRLCAGELLLFPKRDYTQAVFALLEQVA